MKFKEFLGGIALLAAILTLMSEPANAQSIYGAGGQYMGQAQTSGNVTNFYDAKGQFVGSVQTSDNQANFYGAQGNYQGNIAPVYVEPQSNSFMKIVPQVPQIPQIRSY